MSAVAKKPAAEDMQLATVAPGESEPAKKDADADDDEEENEEEEDQEEESAPVTPSICNPAEFQAWDVPFKQKRMEFQAQVKTAGHSPEEIKALDLHKYFSKKHMTALWQDFTRKNLPAASSEIRMLHAETTKPAKVRTIKNPTKIKNEMLQLSLLLPDNKWEDCLATYTELIRDENTKSKAATWTFQGELERTHGRKEFNKMVRANLFEKQVLPCGLVQFKKVVESQTLSSTHKKEVSVKKSNDLDHDEAERLLNAMFNRAAGGFGDGEAPAAAPEASPSKKSSGSRALPAPPPTSSSEDESEQSEERQSEALSVAKQFAKKMTEKKTIMLTELNKIGGDASAESLPTAIRNAMAECDSLLEAAQAVAAQKREDVNVKAAAKLFSRCNVVLGTVKDLICKAKPYSNGGKKDTAASASTTTLGNKRARVMRKPAAAASAK